MLNRTARLTLRLVPQQHGSWQEHLVHERLGEPCSSDMIFALIVGPAPRRRSRPNTNTVTPCSRQLQLPELHPALLGQASRLLALPSLLPPVG
jgi:hypothetical protein